MIAAIILAAGQSSRMGDRNKLLLPWGSQTMLEHVTQVVCGSLAYQTLVVTGHEQDAVARILGDQNLSLVYNPNWTSGKLSSIQAGVRAVTSSVSGYMICLADLPLLESADLNGLIRDFNLAIKSDPRCIVAPYFEGKRGHPVIFSSPWQDDILALKGKGGCRSLIESHLMHVVESSMPDHRALCDTDTPEAYRRLMLAKDGE